MLWDLQEEGYVTSERRVRRLARAAGLCGACASRAVGADDRAGPRQSAAWSIWWTAS